MKIQVFKNETYEEVINLPKKATERSTGYDVISTSDPEIVGEKTEAGYKRIDYVQYRTNLKMAVQKEKKPRGDFFSVEFVDYDILAFPRSSVSKYNLILANCIGLLDADYRGEVLLRFKYIWQPEDLDFAGEAIIVGKPNLEKVYKKGDKICQLKVTRVEDVEFVLVNELDSTDRGDGGFGSSDSKSTAASKQMSTMEALYNKLGGVTTPSKKYTQLVQERDSQNFNI